MDDDRQDTQIDEGATTIAGSAGAGGATETVDTKTTEQATNGKANGSAEAKTIASGADVEAEDKAKGEAADKDHKAYWPTDWREKMAERVAAGDQKIYKKELARLQRISDPYGVYGNYRELEARFTSGGLIKVPGKDAKPEDIAAFHKAIGVPEKPEDYFKDLKLDNGAVIGEADKPLVDAFATALHKAGAPPAAMNAALNWYYQQQEELAAKLDETDDAFRRESEQVLKEEFGPAFKRQVNAIGSIFATAPGGADVKNPGSLYARLMGGRTADGKIIGNDPDMVRWLASLAAEVNPAATVVEDGAGGVPIEAELAQIKALRQTDAKRYWSDAVQAREAELIAAQHKIQARQRA